MNIPLSTLLNPPTPPATSPDDASAKPRDLIMARVRHVLRDAGQWVSLDTLAKATNTKKRSLSTTLSNPRTDVRGLQLRRGWYALDSVTGEPPIPIPVWQQIIAALQGKGWVEIDALGEWIGAGRGQISQAVRRHPHFFEKRPGWLKLRPPCEMGGGER